MEVEITWRRILRVWWALIWRNIVAILVSSLLSAGAGFAIGFVLVGFLGISTPVIENVGGVVGLVIGLGISVFPVKFILGRTYGDFRLVLVEAKPESYGDVSPSKAA